MTHSSKIRVSILDDHQPIIDGYRYRLSGVPDVAVVGAAMFGEELEPMLAQHPTDVLLMDMQVPASPSNPQPYPVLQVIPNLLQKHVTLSILAISMHAKRALISAAMDAGASGYILKDDQELLQRLREVIVDVANGGIYVSEKARNLYQKDEELPALTPRQLEVLYLLAAYPSHTSASVALQLNIAHSTVRNLLSNAYLRLGVSNRSSALLRAQQLGLIPTSDAPDVAGLTGAG